MTEIIADPHTDKNKLNSLIRVFLDLYTSPVDAFDFYQNGNILKKSHIVFFHISLWLYAPISKFIFNFINFYINQPAEDSKGFNQYDGLALSFLIYPVFYILGMILESFRNSYKQNEFFKEPPYKGLGNIAFLPISSTSIFWIFPKPFNAIFMFIGIIYSVKLYYSSIINIDNFSRKDFFRLIYYFLSFILIISFFSILLGNFLRNKS